MDFMGFSREFLWFFRLCYFLDVVRPDGVEPIIVTVQHRP